MASHPLFFLIIGFTLIKFLVVWLILFLIFYLSGRVVAGIHVNLSNVAIISLIGTVINLIIQEIFRWVNGLFPPNLLTPYLEIIGILISAIVLFFLFRKLTQLFFDTTHSVGLTICLVAVISVAIISYILDVHVL